MMGHIMVWPHAFESLGGVPLIFKLIFYLQIIIATKLIITTNVPFVGLN
jgi:hypothetical protein